MIMSESTGQEVFAVFCGSIDEVAVSRIFNGVTSVIGNNTSRLHILFQSGGGIVSYGVCLYNFFRAVTIPISLYNVGCCASIAAISFLGAPDRVASPTATFMLHRTMTSPQSVGLERLQSISQSIVLDDDRTETILRGHLSLSETQWQQHKLTELWFGANDALACGLSTRTGEFSPPIGSRIFNI